MPGPVKVQGKPVGVLVSDPPGALALTSFLHARLGNLLKTTAFVLDPATGAFVATPYDEAAVSPDGRMVAGVVGSRVAVRDRRTGAERRVRLPSVPGYVRWAPRGRRVLVSLYSKGINEGLRGFAVIDAGTLRIRVTAVPGKRRVRSEGEFSWDATGESVVAPGADSRLLRFPAGGGKAGQDVPLTAFYDAREVLSSPSGRTLAADYLHGMTNEIVLWDTTGRTPREVRRLPGLSLVGWYDDARLLALRAPGSGPLETVLTGLDGTILQVLARDEPQISGPGSTGRYSAVPRP